MVEGGEEEGVGEFDVGEEEHVVQDEGEDEEEVEEVVELEVKKLGTDVKESLVWVFY